MKINLKMKLDGIFYYLYYESLIWGIKKLDIIVNILKNLKK